MTMYYSSIDHSVWSPTPFGGGTATQVQYGDGVSNYSADQTALVNARADINTDYTASIPQADRDVSANLSIGLEGRSGWGDANPNWSIEVGQHMPAAVGGTRGRIAPFGAPTLSQEPVFEPTGTPGIANDEANLLLPSPGAPSIATVTQSKVVTYQNAIATVMGRIDFTGKLGGDAGRTWATMMFSDDLNRLWWDDDPGWLEGVTVTQWGGAGASNQITVTYTKGGNAASTAYAVTVLYQQGGGGWTWAPTGWRVFDQSGTYTQTGVTTQQDKLCMVFALQGEGSTWHPLFSWYKVR